MSWIFWSAAVLVTLISAAVLRGTVKFLARSADNGWDNAIGYVLTSALIAYFPLKWMLFSGSWALIAAAPVVLWIAQTVTLRVFYQVNTVRAWTIGVVHTVVATSVLTTLTMIAGVIAAYIMYGRIISDPMILIRLILRLIGIPFPELTTFTA